MECPRCRRIALIAIWISDIMSSFDISTESTVEKQMNVKQRLIEKVSSNKIVKCPVDTELLLNSIPVLPHFFHIDCQQGRKKISVFATKSNENACTKFKWHQNKCHSLFELKKKMKQDTDAQFKLTSKQFSSAAASCAYSPKSFRISCHSVECVHTRAAKYAVRTLIILIEAWTKNKKNKMRSEGVDTTGLGKKSAFLTLLPWLAADHIAVIRSLFCNDTGNGNLVTFQISFHTHTSKFVV